MLGTYSRILLAASTLLCLQSQMAFADATRPSPETLDYQILAEEKHDSRSFTQGWEIAGDFIYESSGGYGRSFIRKSEYPKATIALEKRLPANWFAEGLTVIGDRLYLLSWRQQKGLLLDTEELKPLAQFHYSGEGWGLCHMDNAIYMSNGSGTLQIFNTRFQKQGELSLPSSDNGRAWQNLNELECAKGLIWANIWQEKRVIAIDPQTGDVKFQLDLKALGSSMKSSDAVLNGIAYDDKQDAFWFTGKLWPKRYLLKLNFPEEAAPSAQKADQ
ncbi:glutaminyl-peptide cyclotransferase [Pseudoteredinibacter isoporae]|uniref:Glutamine cyclotransferase n=1 Tax=Pseudoteredinibacter isoporae TaxID=570281 RepID=A0A7X0JUA7_9GAMM|nr:glutaminyl-peptide cyclotransferase [Pseudoteredinibacter isoporae]MBB6522369.1 glutamine cyclotransferase [Pseudoteredinibacter isoporae]NHO87902.1 glutaminyl-peptide cyclotransferase [Pseudoteredinibacter isoporae]NIB23767.1 glutaminyl-peptide cyclotransferase [Pseudoteredinibacter isoporae]